jgi:signal transduction histidine kinase
MKKVALVFVLAVLLPSLVLAWLAVRSLHDQQFLLERQQSLLYQRVTDALAQGISDALAQRQQEFSAQVEALAVTQNPQTLALEFDDQIRAHWPLAEVGFCVTLSGKILSPSPNARPEAKMFHLDNSDFLGNREPVEVYWNNSFTRNGAQNAILSAEDKTTLAQNAAPIKFGGVALAPSIYQSPPNSTALPAPAPPPGAPPSDEAKTLATLNDVSGSSSTRIRGFGGAGNSAGNSVNSTFIPAHTVAANDNAQEGMNLDSAVAAKDNSNSLLSERMMAAAALPAEKTPTVASDNVSVSRNNLNLSQLLVPGPVGGVLPQQSQKLPVYSAAQQFRKVSPMNSSFGPIKNLPEDSQNNLSRVVPAEAEFDQLIGNENDGILARFLQDKLKLMFWHRLNARPDLIFGAQLNLSRVVDTLRGLVQAEPDLRDGLCLALLDDNAKPVALSRPGFSANWKRPFVATEIGESLPHWEVAAYLVHPAQLTQAAHTAELTLGLIIAVLLLAIGVGSWLIVSSLNSELKLARQKTDFVSNVSHELKTPLTSIRMFSELLSEGRVHGAAKQHSYLQIISAEAARLTRLINNVLDFSRLESGEKKYNFAPCDLAEVVRSAADTFRPHLEANGFKFDCELPPAAVTVRGDADALSQIVVNLLSNAEKYSNGKKEITLLLASKAAPLPHAEIQVLDRGSGVPPGSEEKIFEKFYRAHDSLASGVQGSGLGLTIARQIARAHGGTLVYEPRPGGGSGFILRLPLSEGTS